MVKVLIVEDDDVIGEAIAAHLGAAGFDPAFIHTRHGVGYKLEAQAKA